MSVHWRLGEKFPMWLISHYCNIVDYGKFLTYKRLRNSLCLTKAEGGGGREREGLRFLLLLLFFPHFFEYSALLGVYELFLCLWEPGICARSPFRCSLCTLVELGESSQCRLPHPCDLKDFFLTPSFSRI